MPQVASRGACGEIEPFHVMEVQTAARALEAAGRRIVHMEIGEPDFPTPQPVHRRGTARHRRRQAALHVGARPAGTARGDRAPLRDHYRVDVAPGARHRHRRLVGGAAARDGARRRSRRRDPAGGSRLSRATVISCACSKARPVGIPVGPDTRLPAHRRAGRASLARERTRGALIASPSNPTGHHGARPTRCGASRPPSRGAAAR